MVLPVDALVELIETPDSSETLSKATCRVGRCELDRLLLVLLLLLLLSRLDVVAADDEAPVDDAEFGALPVLVRTCLWAVLSPGRMYSTPGKPQVGVRDAIVGWFVVGTGILLVSLVSYGIGLVGGVFSKAVQRSRYLFGWW